MYINKALLYGNLTRDPDLKSLPSGSQVCEFGIATNRVWKDKNGVKQESADFHNIVVFGKQAELVKQYLSKGNAVFVEGRIQTRSWDAQDGTKRYRTEVVADRIQFGPKAGSASSYNKETQSSPDATVSKENAPAIEYPEEEINADDIPF
ncbi:MAG: single-stranded DNA-binding protein [Patescibacteria group bacterium]